MPTRSLDRNFCSGAFACRGGWIGANSIGNIVVTRLFWPRSSLNAWPSFLKPLRKAPFLLYTRKAPGPLERKSMFVPALNPPPATPRSSMAAGKSQSFLEIGAKWLGLLRVAAFLVIALGLLSASRGASSEAAGEWGALPERILTSVSPGALEAGTDFLVEAAKSDGFELEAIESDFKDPGPDCADPRVALRLIPAYSRDCQVVLRDTYVARASSGFHRLGLPRGPPRA